MLWCLAKQYQFGKGFNRSLNVLNVVNEGVVVCSSVIRRKTMITMGAMQTMMQTMVQMMMLTFKFVVMLLAMLAKDSGYDDSKDCDYDARNDGDCDAEAVVVDHFGAAAPAATALMNFMM